jgi:hypothetical protein
MKLDDNFVSDHAGIFPLTFADVKCQTFDRQAAVKNLILPSCLTLSGKLTLLLLPLMVSVPLTSSLPGCWLSLWWQRSWLSEIVRR